MARQVSIEAACDAFRRKYGVVADENVMLEARIADLEAEVEQLRGGQSPQEMVHQSQQQPTG